MESISTTVTCEPRRAQTDPSSSPIAPAPTTTMLVGTAFKAIPWSEEMIVSPSNFMKGSSTAEDPVAMMMFLVSRIRSPDVLRTRTSPAFPSRPSPRTISTPRLLTKNSTPLLSCPTTLSLLAIIAATSKVIFSPPTMPCFLPWTTC